MDAFHIDRVDQMPALFAVETIEEPRQRPDSRLAPVSIHTVDGLRIWTPILGPSSVLMVRLLLEESGRTWHVADLAGQLGLSVAYTQRCLKRLNRFGWLTATERDAEITYHLIDASAVSLRQLDRIHPELAARYSRHCGLLSERA